MFLYEDTGIIEARKCRDDQEVEQSVKVTITMRGTLKKYFGEDKERVYEVPEGCTCDEALQIAGLNYREIKNFGFVSVNNMRVMIDSPLHDGDYLKAFSRVSGG